jgi:ATP-binding protein involved in chromosome partitioning
MRVNDSEILKALRGVNDPELRRSIVDLGMVRDLVVEDGRVAFTLALTIPECPLRDQLVQEARTAVEALPGVKEVIVKLGAMNDAERAAAFGQGEPPPLAARHNAIRHVVAVMSGKGGVGKSLVTGLLASALTRAGYKIGVLDADVTGPSIPKLFGVHGPVTGGPQGIDPITSDAGVKLMSINLLLEDEGEAVIWRGPIISSAIKQFWGDVHWGHLDYLLVDLPPGTSDAALTVMQSLPVTGILMVTTPQALSAMVVRKAVKMAQTVGVPIVGIVENMAEFVAPDTGACYEIFGPSHAAEVAAAAGAPVLARLPIDPDAATQCDAGEIENIIRPEIEPLVESIERLLPVSKTPVPHFEGA